MERNVDKERGEERDEKNRDIEESNRVKERKPLPPKKRMCKQRIRKKQIYEGK